MKENTFIHRMTKNILNILIAVGVLCSFGSFYIARLITALGGYGEKNVFGAAANASVFLAVILFVSGLMSVYILYNLKLMYKTLLGGDPFVRENIVCLRRMALTCLFIAVIYFFKAFFFFTFTTLAVCVTFSIASLFCLTLKDVFKRAINLKEENNLTI